MQSIGCLLPIFECSLQERETRPETINLTSSEPYALGSDSLRSFSLCFVLDRKTAESGSSSEGHFSPK